MLPEMKSKIVGERIPKGIIARRLEPRRKELEKKLEKFSREWKGSNWVSRGSLPHLFMAKEELAEIHRHPTRYYIKNHILYPAGCLTLGLTLLGGVAGTGYLAYKFIEYLWNN